MRKVLFIVLIGLASCFSACRSDIVYTHFSPVFVDETMLSSGGWHTDSILRFTYTITDVESNYYMLVYVRHTERYPYQNMWLFVNDRGRKDTIEFYLADERGRWLGDKHHGYIEMPVLMEECVHYPDTGLFCVEIAHGMRDSVLRGVTDIGLEIIRYEKE